MLNTEKRQRVYHRGGILVVCIVGRRNGVYTRYSMCDWDASGKMQIKLADRESHRAQRLDKRSWEIVNGLEQRMRNRQCSNTKKLGI